MPRHLLTLLILLCTLAAYPNTAGDTIAYPVGVIPDSILSGDSIAEKLAAWQQLRRQPKTEDKSGLWFKELRRGKFNPSDTSIHYPKLIRVGYSAITWFNRTFNATDTNYVRSTGKKFKISVKNNNWFDSYFAGFGPKNNISIVSGASSNIGLNVSFLGIGVGRSLDVKQLFGAKRTSDKFELSFTCSRFKIEYYRMVNRGNVTISGSVDGERFKIRRVEMATRRSKGLNFYYLFNNRRYSQSAAYGFSKLQLRSSGSFLAGLSFCRQSFNVNPSQLDDSAIDLTDSTTVYTFNDYCVNFGYAYNWAVSRNVLLHGSIMPYVGFKYADSNGSEPPYYMISLNAKLGISVTWNLPHIFFGLQGYADGRLFSGGGNNFRSLLTDFNFIAGVRF